MRCLVIVDMQPCFHAANNTTLIDNVINRVIEAKRAKMAIVVLEYCSNYPEIRVGRHTRMVIGQRKDRHTHKEIKRAIGNYPLAVRVLKAEDGGGRNVMEVCGKRGWDVNEFFVCGVNASACVNDTTEELAADSNAQITLLRESIHDGPRKEWIDRHVENLAAYCNARVVGDKLDCIPS